MEIEDPRRLPPAVLPGGTHVQHQLKASPCPDLCILQFPVPGLVVYDFHPAVFQQVDAIDLPFDVNRNAVHFHHNGRQLRRPAETHLIAGITDFSRPGMAHQGQNRLIADIPHPLRPVFLPAAGPEQPVPVAFGFPVDGIGDNLPAFLFCHIFPPVFPAQFPGHVHDAVMIHIPDLPFCRFEGTLLLRHQAVPDKIRKRTQGKLLQPGSGQGPLLPAPVKQKIRQFSGKPGHPVLEPQSLVQHAHPLRLMFPVPVPDRFPHRVHLLPPAHSPAHAFCQVPQGADPAADQFHPVFPVQNIPLRRKIRENPQNILHQTGPAHLFSFRIRLGPADPQLLRRPGQIPVNGQPLLTDPDRIRLADLMARGLKLFQLIHPQKPVIPGFLRQHPVIGADHQQRLPVPGPGPLHRPHHDIVHRGRQNPHFRILKPCGEQFQELRTVKRCVPDEFHHLIQLAADHIPDLGRLIRFFRESFPVQRLRHLRDPLRNLQFFRHIPPQRRHKTPVILILPPVHLLQAAEAGRSLFPEPIQPVHALRPVLTLSLRKRLFPHAAPDVVLLYIQLQLLNIPGFQGREPGLQCGEDVLGSPAVLQNRQKTHQEDGRITAQHASPGIQKQINPVLFKYPLHNGRRRFLIVADNGDIPVPVPPVPEQMQHIRGGGLRLSVNIGGVHGRAAARPAAAGPRRRREQLPLEHGDGFRAPGEEGGFRWNALLHPHRNAGLRRPLFQIPHDSAGEGEQFLVRTLEIAGQHHIHFGGRSHEPLEHVHGLRRKTVEPVHPHRTVPDPAGGTDLRDIQIDVIL